MKLCKPLRPAISIIVPVYNTEKCLRRCLDSIIAQTFADYECILVDDGSLDGCPAICDEYAEKDNRITAIHQENGGVTSARRIGVEHASGDYICFVDSDDALTKDALEILIAKIRQYDLDIIITAVRSIRKNKTRIWNNVITGIVTPKEYVKASLQWQCHIGPHERLIKRKLFNEYIFDLPREISNNEDLIMNLRLGLYAGRIGIFNDITYNYFLRKGSASSKKMNYEDWKPVFELCDEVISRFDNNTDLKKALLRMKILRFGRTTCLNNINQGEIRNIALQVLQLKDLSRWEKIVVIRILYYKYRFFIFIFFCLWKAKQKIIRNDNHVYWFG